MPPFVQAVMRFHVKQTNAALATLSALLQEIDAPEAYFESIGAQLIADATTTASPVVTRTMTVGLANTSAATLLPVLEGGVITGFTVSAPGLAYRGPPIITVPNGIGEQAILRALLDVRGSVIVNGGVNYGSPTPLFQGGLKLPETDNQGLVSEPSCVQSLTLVEGGIGYSANALVQFEATLQPGGRLPVATLTRSSSGVITSVLVTDTGEGLLNVPKVFVWDPGPTKNGAGGSGCVLTVCQMGIGTAATATATISGRAVNTVTIVDHGGPYVSIPKIVVVDATPNSGGAVIEALMGIHAVDVLYGGTNYNQNAHIHTVITDLFTALFGTDAALCAGPFTDVGVRWPLEVETNSPMTVDAPVLT